MFPGSDSTLFGTSCSLFFTHRENHTSRLRYYADQPQPKRTFHTMLPCRGVTLLSSPTYKNVQKAAGPVKATTCCDLHELR